MQVATAPCCAGAHYWLLHSSQSHGQFFSAFHQRQRSHLPWNWVTVFPCLYGVKWGRDLEIGKSSIMSMCLESLGIHEWCIQIMCRNSDMWSEYTPVTGDGIGVQGGRGSAGMFGGLLPFWISVCRNHTASQQCGVPSSSAFKGNAKPITA